MELTTKAMEINVLMAVPLMEDVAQKTNVYSLGLITFGLVYSVLPSAILSVFVKIKIRKATSMPRKRKKARAHLAAPLIIQRKKRKRSTKNLTLMECLPNTIHMIRIQS